MSLEYRRRKMELSRVALAREELELKIEERLEEIERLKAAIDIQMSKEAELTEILKSLESK